MATKRSERVRRVRVGVGTALIAVALLAAGKAGAQTQLGSTTLSGEAELGGRIVWGDENASKFEEYRDLPDGFIGNFDLLLENEAGTHWLRGRGENVGYDDQRYWLEGGRYGRYEIDMFYGELPHIFSNSARTPYDRTGKNSFELAPAFDIALPVDADLFRGVDQELHWQQGGIEAKYHLGESLLFKGSYRIQDKQGKRNWGMNFGSPGGSFTSIPARIKERIHEARVGADWSFDAGSFSVEYLGNFFDNDLGSVTADNPNVTGGSPGDIGRAATAPSNWAQSLSLAGAGTLPLGVPNRVSASFVYGFRYQDEDFLDHSLNFPVAGNPALALPASSLDGQVQTLLGNILATVQPAENVSAKFRYRIYDFENQTDSLLFPANVRNDGTLRDPDPHRSVHNDYTRQNADLDVAWDFARSWTGVLGFGWDYWKRSKAREVKNLHDYGPTLKLDYRTLGGTLLHAGYGFRNREGSNYDALAPIDAVLGSGEVCFENTDKFCEVRKADEADRYLHRFDLLVQVMPTELLELTFSGDLDYADYHDTDFGLTEAFGWHVGGDAYYQVHERVGLLAYYSFDSRKFWQDSRRRSPNFVADIGTVEGPNWNSNTHYWYHNGGVTVRLALLPEKLDADIGYQIELGKEKTQASGGADAILGVAAAEDLPRVQDRLQAVHATVAWHFTDRVTLRGGYRWEKYDITNFRDDNVPASLSDGRNLYLGDSVGDYTAHIFGISAVIRF